MEQIKKTKSTSHTRRIDYYPAKVPYYPSKVTTKILIQGYAIKHSMSMSEVLDKLVCAFFKQMTDGEKEVLRQFSEAGRD